MPVRLNKFIAESGISSRRKAEEFILQGRVTVNRKTITELSFKVNPDEDEVFVDGERIKQKQYVYYLLNKPKGVITTTDDEKNRMTVVDLIKTNQKIFPVGRLDYNTTGVLFLTNDGNFSNLLTHPKNKIQRVYEVNLDRNLEDDDKSTLLKGVYIEGEKGVFIKVEFPKIKDRKRLIVTCTEGRNKFVKRMFEALGYTVVLLNRISFAGMNADIPLGTYRKLTTLEVKNLFKNYAK
ncbi:MAG: rRNA pseudouridine synthase [Ignavibacteriaceae bacterium]|nr:rRNA pseudouridine synthase [Ignavibacteriaceae bacterium]